MTKDEIMHMAREPDIDWHKHWGDNENRLERFAALVAAHEREACAKVCESEGQRIDASWSSCAAAIRARGEK
jgi:hypothetical protein